MLVYCIFDFCVLQNEYNGCHLSSTSFKGKEKILVHWWVFKIEWDRRQQIKKSMLAMSLVGLVWADVQD